MTFYDDDEDRLESGPQGARFPSLKLKGKGDEYRLMMFDYDNAAPVFEYGTKDNRRAITVDGRERTKDVLTGVVLPGTNCVVSLPRKAGQMQNEEVPAEPGMVVRVHIQGHNRYDPSREDAFRNAKESHGEFRVGDVVRGVLADITLQGRGGTTLSQPKKVISFAMRKPRDEEMTYVAQARDERRKLRDGQREQISQPTAPTPAQPQLQPQSVAAAPAAKPDDLW